MDTIHTLGLFPEHETHRQYSVRDFLRIARTTQLEETVFACHLCYIPSRSSCYHEFLLVHMELHVLIVERVPTNNGMRVISSNGGTARDTITVVRTREDHEYWQSAGRDPVCKGTLQWHRSWPRLVDIASIANAASTNFKRYNLYVRQCYFYARITLDAMARAFPPCSRQGTTSFLRKGLAMLGTYNLSQVQRVVEHYREDVRAIETERHASRSVTPDNHRHLVMFIAGQRLVLVGQMCLEPGADIAIRHGNHTSGGIFRSWPVYGVSPGRWPP